MFNMNLKLDPNNISDETMYNLFLKNKDRKAQKLQNTQPNAEVRESANYFFIPAGATIEILEIKN